MDSNYNATEWNYQAKEKHRIRILNFNNCHDYEEYNSLNMEQQEEHTSAPPIN